MPCERLSQGPATWSTWNFRGSRRREAFRGLEAAPARFLKASETGADNSLYRYNTLHLFLLKAVFRRVSMSKPLKGNTRRVR